MILKARPCAAVALAVFLAAMSTFVPIRALAAVSDLPDGKPVTVPMTLSFGHIFITVEINGKPGVFVLDSGAGADILSTDAAKRLGVATLDTDRPIVTTGVGGQQQTWLGRLETLKVGGAELKNSPVFLVDLPHVLKADGLLGYEFLHRFVTTIDYQAKTVTFRDAPPSPTEGTALPMALTGNVPGIDADLDGKRGRFQIDTGDSGSVDVNTPFVKRHGLREKYHPRLDVVTGVGVGGEDRSSVVRVPSMKVGPLTIKSAIVNLSMQTQGAFSTSDVAGTLGYDILSRFKITLDYKNKKVILADAGVNDKPFQYNRSGMGLSILGETLKVGDVIAGSPAEQAGIAVGDEVIAVNGALLVDSNFDALRQAIRGAPGDTVQLTLRSPSKDPREVTLTLRELL
ncbi:MAG: aspartyl protease family protein [Capsulimonas sp.]|uniref:aspartyl protease family protein n=1 Tax=Capsulimonas sp. TaxID=2494211 RepID=UPI003267CF50